MHTYSDILLLLPKKGSFNMAALVRPSDDSQEVSDWHSPEKPLFRNRV